MQPDVGMPCTSYSPQRLPSDPDDLLSFQRVLDGMVAGDTLLVPCGSYQLGGSIRVRQKIVIRGAVENPHYHTPDVRLNTTVDAPGIVLLSACTIRDVTLDGATTGWQHSHGIWARRSPRLHNLVIQNYPGDGVFIDSSPLVESIASAGADAAGNVTVVFAARHRYTPGMLVVTDGLEFDTPAAGVVVASATTAAPWSITYVQAGVPARAFTVDPGATVTSTNENANHWQVDQVLCKGNGGNGFHTLGESANAGLATNLDCTNNAGIGVLEQAFLSNTYVACHVSGSPQSYVKPASADNNRSVFLGCYAEGSAPSVITYPAGRHSGNAAWTGSGLASGFDASYKTPTVVLNHDPDNDHTVATIAASVAGDLVTVTVAASPAHRVLPGMRVTSSGLSQDSTAAPVVSVTTTSITYQDAGLTAGTMADGTGTLTVSNHLELNLGGATHTLYGYKAHGNGLSGDARSYRKQFSTTRASYANWFITSYNNQEVVEAESGDLARDNTGTIGAAHKWFPRGLYFGGAGDMWKLSTERRGPTRVMTLRDSANAPDAPVASAWLAAPPTAGTWRVGDVVWNTTPSPIRPIGWICTVAAPLTFVEMPRLNAVAEPGAAVARSIGEVLRVPFSPGPPGSTDDVVIYGGASTCPGAMRILDVTVLISTASLNARLQLRDALAGQGNVCSDEFDGGVLGRHRDTGAVVRTTPVIAAGGSLALRRVNTSVAGELILIVQRS